MLDWQSHKQLRIFIRTICVVLIVTFFSYDLTWAGAGDVFCPKNRLASQVSPAVEIPQELGVIKDSYTSKYNPRKLVIHIQDAHANVEAQENEAKLIKYLKDKYNVNLVSVEGGFGDFNAEFFRDFPKDKKIRDKIAKYFLSKAFISGPDYLLITENNPPAVYGAEDKELYTAHLNTFKDNQTNADSLNKSLNTLEDVVGSLKDKYYSKDLKELDSKISDFRQGRISLEEYISYLNIGAIINDADLSKFPNLYNLITSQGLEHKINFNQAETERQDLIDSLTKALSKRDLEELVKTSLDFKANKITPVEYYSYLEKLTKEAGIKAGAYNNLFTYIKYITLSQNLDNSKVFDEIDDFTQSLKEKLASTSIQKDIDNLTYIIRVFKGLSDINLSPKEYEHFKNTREEFNQRKLAQLFKRYIDSSYIKSLPSDAEIDSLEKFYSLAHDRDKAIVSNSLNRLNREYSTNAVIIVAGGFHTQGITSTLKEKDISYVVVAPSIKKSQEKENTYFALLKDKKLPLQDILNEPDTLQIINSITDPQARQLLINYWVARSTRYYSTKEIQAQLSRLRLATDDQKAAQLALGEFMPSTAIVKKNEKQFSSPIIPHQPQEGKTSLVTSVSVKPVSIQPALFSPTQVSFVSQGLAALKKKTKKIFLSLAVASMFFASQPAMAHYFTPVPDGQTQAVVQVWDRNTPAEDTLGGIARDVLQAQGKKVTPALLYGKDGLVEQLAKTNGLVNPSLLHPNQQITLPSLDTQTASKLLGRIEEQTTAQRQVPQVTSVLSQTENRPQTEGRLVKIEQKLSQAQEENKQAKEAIQKLTGEQEKIKEKTSLLETRNQALEEKVSDVEKRLDKAEQRISQAEKKQPEFKEYANNWWQSLSSGWKAVLSILAAFGVGLGVIRLYLQRKWSRLKELREGVRRTQEEKNRLDTELDSSREKLGNVKAELERANGALEDTQQQRKAQEERLRVTQAQIDTLEAKPLKEEKLQDAVTQLEQAVALRKNDIESEISSEEARLARLKNEAQELENKHSQYEDRITQLEASAKTLEQEIRALEEAKVAQKIAIQDTIREANTQLEEVQQAVLEAQQKLAVLNSQLETLEARKKESDKDSGVLGVQKTDLESGIAKLMHQSEGLSQAISGLISQKEDLIRQQTQLNQAVENKAAELEALERKISGLGDRNVSVEITGLERQRNELVADIETLRQNTVSSQQDSRTRTVSLDGEIAQRQKQLEELKTKIAFLGAQKSQLEQELSALSQRRQQETQDLEQRLKQKQAIEQQTVFLNAQLEEVKQEIGNLNAHFEELKARRVSLDTEVPALTRRKEALEKEVSNLQEGREKLEALTGQTGVQLDLSAPYAAMVFDIDNTLTEVTSDIDDNLLNLLLDFLDRNVQIALVTAQGINEVKQHIINKVPSNRRHVLLNLSIYPSGGAKCFRFDKQGNSVNDTDYDATTGLTMLMNPAKVESAIRGIVNSNAGVGFRDGLITITGLSNREEAFGKLISLFKEEGWHFVPRLAGRHTIHILIGGVDKARAATHFKRELEEKVFFQKILPQQILAIGDSFYGGGLDADLISALPKSHIVSVGRKPQEKQFRELSVRGIVFSEDIVGVRDWQATYKILLEVRKGKTVKEIGKDKDGKRSSGILRSILVFMLSGLSLFSPVAGADYAHPLGSTLAQMSEEDKNVVKQATARARVEELSGCLDDKSKRDAVIDRLVEFGVPSIGPLLEGMARHDYRVADFDLEAFHKACQEALERMGWTRAVAQTLMDISKDQSRDVYVSWAAMRQLAKFKNQDAIDVLYKILTTDKRGVDPRAAGLGWRGAMHEAAECLAGIGDENAISALRRATHSEDVRVREVAKRSLNENDKSITEVIKESGVILAQAKPPKTEFVAPVKPKSVPDNQQRIAKAAKALPEKPKASVIFNLEDYQTHPEQIISVLNNLSWGGDQTVLLEQVTSLLLYTNADGSVNSDIIRSAFGALHRTNRGDEAIAGLFNPQNYQQKPENLKVILGALVGATEQKIMAALYRFVLEPADSNGQYIPELNKSAAQVLLSHQRSGDLRAKIEMVCGLFTPENYQSKPAQLALIMDTLSENYNIDTLDTPTKVRLLEKLRWVIDYVPSNDSANVSLVKSALRNIAQRQSSFAGSGLMVDSLLSQISHPDEDIRAIAMEALVKCKVSADKVRPFLQSENMLERTSARQILEQISPDSKGKIFISEEEARENLFLSWNHQAAAKALREFSQDKPWKDKIPAYLLSYLANLQILLAIGLSIGVVVISTIVIKRRHQVNIIYKKLLAYAGKTTFWERRSLRAIAVSLAKQEDYDVYDAFGLIARSLSQISKTSKIKQIEKLAVFLDKLNKAGLNSQYILEHGVPLVARIAKDEAEFDKGLVLLEDLAVSLKLHSVDIRTVNLESNNLDKLVKEFAVFEALCGFIKDSVSQNKQTVNELLTAVIPEAFKGAKDANVKIARLQIIRQLVLGNLHPTQLLIETLQKTTSQSHIPEQVAQWKRMLLDFKSGATHFDANNPLHVDLEYTTYRQLAPQVSLSTSYNDYKDFIKRFNSSTGPASSLGNQEAGEIRLAVYEAYRLLEFIITIKAKADKLGRPLWVVPNLSYGKFAVSPILDELAKLGVEIHYAKVGSTECHNNPELVKPGLFTDDVYQRILRERPVIIAVDGTKHLLARPNERKSSRYPDAYVGYRNFIVAVDDVLSGGRVEVFHDRVRVSTDFLNRLRQNSSDYNALTTKLKGLGSSEGQDTALYRLEFWNPGGLQLVIREARQEVQNVTPFDPEHLDSQALIFINSPLLDEDVPSDIKKWSGLEGTHEPAFFDDRAQIQQNALAINGRGVYLTHALEFETNRASQQLKGFYKGNLPQVEYKEPTPESVRSAYEAMLFDLDGTLTDTLKDIDKVLLDKLIYFLSSGVIMGIVTSQSLDEVKEHMLDRMSPDKKQHLGNLFLYTNRGVQLYNFDGNANPILINDRAKTDVTEEQRVLIRQLINQALGTLSGSTRVIDRQAQISIHLDKHKDKRDLVNATLSQLIAANNLPFQTEYSGSSTMHVVLRGIDKGTAKDNFLNQVIPSRLNRAADVSKLLIVGDRFQGGGSDRPMIVQGARVVSVGKEKGLPNNIENYPHHGWEGTDQLLGDIIHKAGRSTVSVPAAFFSSLGLSDFWQTLNSSLEGLYDASKRPLLYAGIAVLGLAFIFATTISVIKLYKTNHLYSEIIKTISFLERRDRVFLFREISRHVSWKKIQRIEPYQLFVDILPVLSKGIQDKRIQEINNTAGRLRKSKLNPRHLFKYCLPAIAKKSKDTKQFVSSLGIAERLALTLQDKHYDYHELLRDILPSLERTTRNIDELNEAMLLGIKLLKSGRNPTFALTKMLPEVISLTKNLTDFKLGVYALQELCLAGFESTKYLLAELIKQGTQTKIDAAIVNWREMRRKFKTGDIAFNHKNELHVNLEYTTFRELVDRTLKETHRYSYSEYLEILKNFNNGNKHASVGSKEKAEIKFAAYEAYRLREFILEVKRQADKLGRSVWVVPNLSYGRFAVSPLLRDLAKDGIEVHYARIGSSESHEHPTLVKPDLFNANLYDRIINEQPVIIVVDGTQHLLARPKDRKSGRYPDAYVGYRNLIIAVNDILSRGQEQVFKQNVRTTGHFIRDLRKKSDYKTLRRRLLRLFDPTVKTKRYLYNMEFWNPGGLELAVREARQEVHRVRPVSPSDITRPAMIFVNSAMLDEDIPVFMRDWITKGKKIHHLPAYFDDTSHIQRLIFNVDTSGVSLSDALNENVYREYGRIKGIYQQRPKLPIKPKDLAKLPYKTVISDLDGTLANTLEEVPRPVMEKLLYLLSLGVQVAIVTTQSYKEVERYLLSQVPAQNKALLANLTVYTATGSQGFGFDKNGDPLALPLYDTAGTDLTAQEMQAWRQIINSLLKEYGLDKEAKDKKGQVVAAPARIIDAGSQIIIRLKERGFLRREIHKRLQLTLNKAQLPITLKEIGRTSIRMTIKGVDKSIAVKYHLTTVCKDRFGFVLKPSEVLILGNSFDEDGDDRDMMVKGAKVFSVGGRPFSQQLRGGINFYPQGGWQGSNQLLAEFINFLAVNIEENAKLQAKPESVKLNSFNFLPFLAAGGVLENMDPFTGFVAGCLAGIIVTVLIFKNKIFASQQPEIEEDIEKEVQSNTLDSPAVKPDNLQERAPVASVQPKKPYDFDSVAEQIRRQYPGVKIGIIGATAPTRGYTRVIGEQLGKKLRSYVGDNGFVFTGGVAGVGVDVYKGALQESQGKEDRFFTLLPEGVDADYEYNDLGLTKVRVVHFGRDMFERRIGMGKVADVIILLNGRGGTLHEAIAALEAGKKVIALDYGGAGSFLYHAKARNELPPGLIQQGLRPEYLKNIILADLENIEEVLNAAGLESTVLTVVPSPVLSEENQFNILKVDPYGRQILTVDAEGSVALTQQAVAAINSLSSVYNGLTLEMDVDTLIDTSKGMPQLKGIGFKEAVVSLYQAQEKKQIPESVRIRLININPRLDRAKIIKVLGLTDDLLKKMVDIPDIPQDYLIRTLAPYLTVGSIRIIFEDNVKYWGKKVDVLVRRGQETQTLSNLGLIVAALAKEPKFYQSLPQDVKDCIVAKTDGNGKVALDDEGKIKQLIFKPIEKTKVDTQYLDKLDKANKELEGMV